MHHDISNQFNFDNVLDLSYKKDKTMNNFSRDIPFQQFMNINQKTFSQDKQDSKINTSDFFKKQFYSNLSRKDLSFASKGEHSFSKNQAIGSKRDLENQLSNHSSLKIKTSDKMQIQSNLTHSPKFAQPNSSTSIPLPPQSRRKLQSRLSGSFGQRVNEQTFRKKQDNNNEQQYKQLQYQIKYYEQQIQKISYESMRMQEQAQNLLNSFSPEEYEYKLKKNIKQIQEINKKIEEQRQIQIQLTHVIRQLEDSYEGVTTSIKNANFQRPAVIKDHAKIILDQINKLKSQFQVLERDQGSLCLSTTLQLPNTNQQITQSISNINTSSNIKNNKDNQICKIKIKQIFEENKNTSDSRFLQNIKLACVKQQTKSRSLLAIAIIQEYKSKLAINQKNNYNDSPQFSKMNPVSPIKQLNPSVIQIM